MYICIYIYMDVCICISYTDVLCISIFARGCVIHKCTYRTFVHRCVSHNYLCYTNVFGQPRCFFQAKTSCLMQKTTRRTRQMQQIFL